MISMNNVSSADHALHYFSSDNYYTQDQGLDHCEWFGKGAQHLGLSGHIDRQAFFDVLNGNVDGQALGKWIKNEETGQKERDHRPGLDVTFSAPKSVSLLAEINDHCQVRQAHEASVKTALGYIETECAMTRQTIDGKTKPVQTGNITVALFAHNTSRDLDPQTHTHAVIMNATKRADGPWRSLTNEEIYNAQRVIGAIYTSELSARLQALGYELYRTDEKGNFEIAGITREQVKHFSQRRINIEAALKAKGIEIDHASAQQKEEATLKTRASKVTVDQEALLTHWKARAQAVGINFEAIQTAAHVQRKKGGIRANKMMGIDAISFAAAHLTQRETVVSQYALMATAIEHSAGRISAFEVKRAFEKCKKSSDLIILPDGNITTKKMLSSEMWMLEQVRLQKSKTRSIMSPQAVTARIAQAEGRQGFKYSAGQKEAISKVLTRQDRYVGVQGLAGTGKTTMLKALREMAQEQGYTVLGMAATGAASKVLARETGIATDTVSMFQIKAWQLDKNIAQQTTPDFERKGEVWIVDESSFLSQRQNTQLNNMAEKADAKVVYLGDTFQLQGVEAGKPFELAQRNGMETATMTKINRQKTANLKQVVDIITGQETLGDGERLPQVVLNNNTRAFETMDKAGMVYEIAEKSEGDKNKLVTAVVQDLLKMDKLERERTLVITAYNEDRRAINAGVREGLKVQGKLSRTEDTREIYVSKGWTPAMQKEVQYYTVGDVVRFGLDYKSIEIKKGECCRVVTVDAPNGNVVLQKETGTTMVWQPKKYHKVEVYDADTRKLGKGDLIRLTRNEGALKNGEVAKVIAVIGENTTLELKQGKYVLLHEVDLSRYKHWDYGYAQTVHVCQGTTQHRVIFHIRAAYENEQTHEKALASMARVFGDRSFYVGTTRASHDLCIYTNDKSLAAMALAAKQGKTSAIETIQRHEDFKRIESQRQTYEAKNIPGKER